MSYLWRNPWRNVRKPVKNKQNPLTNQSKGDTNTGTRRMCHAGHINRAGIRTRYASRYKQLPTPTHATVVHARASIICEAAALCWRVARSLPLFMDAFSSTDRCWWTRLEGEAAAPGAPLALSKSTALRVRRSVRFLDHYSP